MLEKTNSDKITVNEDFFLTLSARDRLLRKIMKLDLSLTSLRIFHKIEAIIDDDKD